jgi:hypothetical protein
MTLLGKWQAYEASEECSDWGRGLNLRTWGAKHKGIDARVFLADFRLSRLDHKQRNTKHSSL